jgi:hypothetical protein
MHAVNTPDRWNLGTLIAFRFLAVYFIIAFLSSIIGIVPFLGDFGLWLDAAERPLHVWIGRTVFGVEITALPTGSGDTTYNWVQFAAHLAFASVATLAWSLLDRKRPSYPWLRDGLWIAMRFVLAATMLGYGFSKVYGLQFPEPDVTRLLQEYGQSSPMGLLWTFIGASQPYSMFGGWMEVIGGILLCFRRTQLLGALWTAAVMTNVFVLNLCYDVPVKLYSFHLLVLALVIAAPDMRRLVRLFVLNRPTDRTDLRGPWTKPALRRTAFVVKIVWLAVTLAMTVYENSEALAARRDASAEGGLAGTWNGTWDVVEFRRDGVELDRLGQDARRWKYFALVERPEMSAAVAMQIQGARIAWRMERSGDTLVLRDMRPAAGTDASAAPPAGTLELAREGDERFRLSGTVNGVRIEATCERRDTEDFPLMSRGFHWINEVPYGR